MTSPQSIQLPLALLVVFACTISARGVADGLCAAKAEYYDEIYYISEPDGVNIFYIPYQWCMKNCAGWSEFPLEYMGVLVVQFILPTVIFALVIPRRFRLDLPDAFFEQSSSNIRSVLKFGACAILIAPVVFVDLVIWVSAILMLSGPMILGGLHEIYLDYKTLAVISKGRNPSNPRQLSAEERLELLISILCGNFGDRLNLSRQHIKDKLSPNKLDRSKSRLTAILNAQNSFGLALGISMIFFLGGFLYNAIGINKLTIHGINWTPYAIWLMVMLYVAVVSATCLTGNNPSVVNILTRDRIHPNANARWHILVDSYEDELCPAAMWDRGIQKRNWLTDSQAYRASTQVAREIDLGFLPWLGLQIAALFLSLFSVIVAYEMAYHIPHKRIGCRSLSYILYGSCQVWLILVQGKRSHSEDGLRFRNFPTSNSSLNLKWQLVLRQIIYSISIVATVTALLLSLFISLGGSICQILGIYNNCVCQTPASMWILPVRQRQTWLGDNYETRGYNEYIDRLATSLTWTAAVVTTLICSCGWLY